jgi:hypothetical protein
MREIAKAVLFMLIGFALLAPFASPFPDGLETVAENLGVTEPEPLWSGLMPDYTLPTIENPYISNLMAGIFGVFLVLATAFALGKTLDSTRNKRLS